MARLRCARCRSTTCAEVEVDAVVYQAHEHWLVDRHEVLSPAQRAVPQIVVEHDPPRQSPTDTRHPVDDPDALIVHVTAFNDLMWDCGATPTTVIEHGVVVPVDARYPGHLERGITVVNGLAQRGRRLGLDVFLRAREQVPLDLVGMRSEELGGLGEVPPPELRPCDGRLPLLLPPRAVHEPRPVAVRGDDGGRARGRAWPRPSCRRSSTTA